jgi:hypothetical protein
VPEPLSLLTTAYGDLAAVLSSLTVEEGWQPTGCAGWTPVDLGFHLLSDARRALVALNTPAPGPVDTDAVSYWTAWRPPAPGDEEELWSTRIAASVHGGLRGIAGRYAETTAAVLVAAGRVELDDPVGTQGRVLTGSDLLSTLTVEAAVHTWTSCCGWNAPARPPGRWPRCAGCWTGCSAGLSRRAGTTSPPPGAAPAGSR